MKVDKFKNRTQKKTPPQFEPLSPNHENDPVNCGQCHLLCIQA